MAAALLLFILVLAALGMGLFWRGRKVTTIYPPSVGLLYRDGRFVRELGPGRYTHFDPAGRNRIVKVSTAALPLPMGEVTVVSRDQFSFKVGLSPILEVKDARAFAESQPTIEPSRFVPFMPDVATHPALHSRVASAAVEVVGAHPLRALFAEPKLLTSSVQTAIADAIPGALVVSVLMTSITLPPETRKMFTEVERSKIEAEAALERARGEQAALRALANAARLIKDNPALANLRFLQTLEQAPGPKTIVLGGDAVAPFSGGSQTGG